MVSSNAKGGRVERQLIGVLGDCGFVAMRAPASGSATVRELPDVLAGRRVPVPGRGTFTEAFAFEVKASSGEPIYVDGDEVDKLGTFARGFGARPRLAVKFDVRRGDPAWGDDDRSGFYAFDPADVYTTDGGNYRVKKQTALAEGVPVERL